MQIVCGLEAWENTGVHPTPPKLVKHFAAFVALKNKSLSSGCNVRLLDACSGDARLGLAAADILVAAGHSVQLTCVDVNAAVLQQVPPRDDIEIVTRNESLFSERYESFDVVVSNPPYLALNKSMAASLNFSWAAAVEAGGNLYALSILRCLALLRHGGSAFFIAPHSWIANVRSESFRKLISAQVSSVEIIGFRDRNLFPSVSQDVAFQHFVRKEGVNGGALANAPFRFSYENDDDAALKRLARSDKVNVERRAFVGALVWNRTELELKASRVAAVPVIYGGNICSDQTLDLTRGRYSQRQFVNRKAAGEIVRSGPALLIKRSMRGSPGEWKVDVALVSDPDFLFVPENHVIVILLKHASILPTSESIEILARALAKAHYGHGHPNLSVQIVNRVLAWKRFLKVIAFR